MVQFYSAADTADDAGSATVVYTLEFSALVNFQVEKVSKDDAGEIRPSAREFAKVRMAFTERVKYSWRLKYQESYYDIEQIRDPNGLRRNLELTVVNIEQ